MSFFRLLTKRNLCTKWKQTPEFGLLFDIDGVIMRGSKVIPQAPEAFAKLTNSNGKFRVPTVFVTNAGNCLRQTKANQLSSWLNVEVTEDQVVMSHSPLKMFREYHERHVLVVGQGPIKEIARNLGFTKISTMDDYRHAFPTLDAVDHERRQAAPCGFESFFPRIEAIVLFGEPIRWETSLQLLIDALLTNGLPTLPPESTPVPHLPVLACNMDLQWMAEAIMPRFGHGAFLLCLEDLYKKVTGQDLVYTALVGKPSEITYRHGEQVLQQQAQLIYGDDWKRPLKNIYFVGDNVCTDIFGANLYNEYLTNYKEEQHHQCKPENLTHKSRSIEQLFDAELSQGAEKCISILVETGVYTSENDQSVNLNHLPRDFLPVEENFLKPSIIVPHVSKAVEAIFECEEFT